MITTQYSASTAQRNPCRPRGGATGGHTALCAASASILPSRPRPLHDIQVSSLANAGLESTLTCSPVWYRFSYLYKEQEKSKQQNRGMLVNCVQIRAQLIYYRARVPTTRGLHNGQDAEFSKQTLQRWLCPRLLLHTEQAPQNKRQ